MTNQQIKLWRKQKGDGLVSAIGEYTPDEFWAALEEIEKLRNGIKKCCKEYHAITWGCDGDCGSSDIIEELEDLIPLD